MCAMMQKLRIRSGGVALGANAERAMGDTVGRTSRCGRRVDGRARPTRRVALPGTPPAAPAPARFGRRCRDASRPVDVVVRGGTGPPRDGGTVDTLDTTS